MGIRSTLSGPDTQRHDPHFAPGAAARPYAVLFPPTKINSLPAHDPWHVSIESDPIRPIRFSLHPKVSAPAQKTLILKDVFCKLPLRSNFFLVAKLLLIESSTIRNTN